MKQSELRQMIREELELALSEQGTVQETEQLEEGVMQVLQKLGLTSKIEKVKQATAARLNDLDDKVIVAYDKLKADPKNAQMIAALDKLALQFKGTNINQSIDKVMGFFNPSTIPTEQLTEGSGFDVFKSKFGNILKGAGAVSAAAGPVFALAAFLYNPLYMILMPILGAGGIASVTVGIVAVGIVLNVIGNYLANA